MYVGLLIVFENDRFVFGKKRSFLKTIVFLKTISDRFLNDCFLKNDR